MRTYDDCDRQPLPRHADHSDHDKWMMMIRRPKIYDCECACGAADKDEDNADGNADAADDHLYQETGGRAPRQLCCIAVTVYIAISKHCHIKVLPYQGIAISKRIALSAHIAISKCCHIKYQSIAITAHIAIS